VILDKPLWGALAVFVAALAVIVLWLAAHHGTPSTDRPMVLPCLVAILALNAAYLRMSKLTDGWTSWEAGHD